MKSILLKPKELADHLGDPSWAVIDCRFWLDDTEKGRRDYRQYHIPDAIYAHVDEDLSGPIISGVTGRHPLPPVDEFAAKLGLWGIGPGVQVVAYDDRGGAIAARMWWLLNWLGFNQVALLDGGWQAWQDGDYPETAEIRSPAARKFEPNLQADWIASTSQVEKLRDDPGYRLLDSRTPERYRGDEEPIDPVAGHIPGARSLPFPGNLDENLRFLPVEALRERFLKEIGETPSDRVVFYCGSGVTGAHNVFAFAHAGLGKAKLYTGSWSEWITDPEHPIATV